jgi:hypothetical protein
MSTLFFFIFFFIPVCNKIIQGVEPIWLEKELFWLETNKMAEKNVKFPHR